MKTIMKFRNLLSTAGILLASAAFVSCDKEETPVQKNIVELAQSDTTLSILVSAVSKAGLATTLSTTANLTVFAPTNAAFRAAGYPQTVIDALTATQVNDILIPILTYHVVGASVASSAVPASDTVKTLNGKNIFASKNANGVFVNGIAVTAADLNASNGIVHKIAGVLVPPSKTIAQIVIDDPANFSLLLAAVSRAGLAGALSGAGKFTVFAPTNAAFSATPFNTEAAINAADATAVAGIVKAHVIGTNVFASDLISGGTAPTLNSGQTLTVSLPAAVKITGSSSTASAVTSANIIATNGVVHVINKVIL